MLLVIPRSRFEAVILSNACNDKKWKPDAMETRRVSDGEAATESALADSEEHRCPIFPHLRVKIVILSTPCKKSQMVTRSVSEEEAATDFFLA